MSHVRWWHNQSRDHFWIRFLWCCDKISFMVGHLFQNYDTIYVRFFSTYTCNHSWYMIYVRFFGTYTCVLPCFVGFLFPSTWPFSYKRAYICAQKSHIYALQTSVCIWGNRKSSYKRHRIIPTIFINESKTNSIFEVLVVWGI